MPIDPLLALRSAERSAEQQVRPTRPAAVVEPAVDFSLLEHVFVVEMQPAAPAGK